MRRRLRFLYERDNGICWLCNETVAPEEASRDHIRPVSRGGSNHFDNLRLAHRRCNTMRGDRMPLAAWDRIGRKRP